MKKKFLPKKRFCEKCGETHYCETHHVHPSKYYKDEQTLELCRDCHITIHWLIDSWGKLYKYQYDTITKRWLKGIILIKDDVLFVLIEKYVPAEKERLVGFHKNETQ